VNQNQIIVAADVTDQANDVRQVEPMLDLTITNIDQACVTENLAICDATLCAVRRCAQVSDLALSRPRCAQKTQVPCT